MPTFIFEPLLKGWLRQREALKQIAAIKRRCALKSRWCTLGGRIRERGDVGLASRRVEREGIALLCTTRSITSALSGGLRPGRTRPLSPLPDGSDRRREASV